MKIFDEFKAFVMRGKEEVLLTEIRDVLNKMANK